MDKLYLALRSANVPDDAAREASEEAAGFENRLAKVETDLLILKWIGGSNLAHTLAILGKLLAH
jgi:hypothetical protein